MKTKTHELAWRDNDLPVSIPFDDPYYSTHDGRLETDHVFIQGNHLPARWKKLSHSTIAELGFGTGLNFLETVRQWHELSPPEATLDFVSFEQFPISKEAMARALSHWQELDPLRPTLCELWLPEVEILQVEFLPNISLTVFMGDANVRLPQLSLTADAWYLDGFAPARNPQLWNAELMQQVFDHTRPGGTFATYSAAGSVRRNLQAAGFKVSKTTGFAGKRDMLTGRRPEMETGAA